MYLIIDNDNSVSRRWIALQNSLAGLFCASLASSADTSTHLPTLTFPPEGLLPTLLNSSHNYFLHRTTLPAERLCTENLTPFLKLLPCKSRAGLAELLNPHALVGADWHGMGVHVKWVDESSIELKMIIRSVFNPVRMTYARRSTLLMLPRVHTSLSGYRLDFSVAFQGRSYEDMSCSFTK